MKKFVLITLTAISLSGCSALTEWSSNSFFGGNETPPNPSQPDNNFPYYYNTAAAPVTSPIDAQNGEAYRGVYPPAAPGSISTYQPQQAGGYGVQPNTPSVSLNLNNGGSDVSAAKIGAAPQAPQPVLPTQQQMQYPPQQGYAPQQYAPQNYAPQAYQQQPQMQSPAQYQQPVQMQQVQPVQPQQYYPPQAQPVQPQQQGGMTQEQYQQLYYGQQYAPQTYSGQYQYPPANK